MYTLRMCASYMIRQRNPQLLGLPVDLRIDDFEQYCDALIVPRRPAPVIRHADRQTILTSMQFSLLPSWSKEPKVKFATHNARLETIDVKPVWRSVFVKKHCLVPMTAFIEPVYSGQFAGQMVAFAEIHGNTKLAAGIWDEWVNHETGEVITSFSIITFDPPPFVADTGHDRCPVFLSAEDGTAWLASEGQPAKELKNFLFAKRFIPELTATTHRLMKPGWEKRK